MTFNLRLQFVEGPQIFGISHCLIQVQPCSGLQIHGRQLTVCILGSVGKCSSWFEKSLLGAEEQAWPCLGPFMGLISSNLTKIT